MSSDPTIAAQPVRASFRIGAIDGLRGAFLVLMTLTHVTVPGGSILKAFHPDTISFIDSATGFVFLSGLMSGLVYAKMAARRGLGEAARRMRIRAVQLYGYSVLLIALIVGASLVLPGAAVAWSEWAGPLTRPDGRAVAAAALLLQEASFADVLPMYAFYLLLGQAALWMCLTGRTAALLATSLLVWSATQVGVTEPLTQALARGLVLIRPDLVLPDAFNLLSWQILFIAGLAAGVAYAQGRLNMQAIFQPKATYLFWLSVIGALAIAAATLGLRLHHPQAWTPGSAAWLIDLNTQKERLGVGCLLNFAIFAYPVAWMLAAGDRASGALGLVSRAFAWLIDRPFLRLLGRHSLQVYAWQVVLIYGLKLLDAHLGASNPVLNAGLILGCMALLAAPALLRERRPKPAVVTQDLSISAMG